MKNFPLDPYPRRKTPLKEWRPFIITIAAYAATVVVAGLAAQYTGDYRNGLLIVLGTQSVINLAFFYVLLKP